MQRARASHVRAVVHHMIQLVWILAANTLEREPRKVRCLLASQTKAVLWRLHNGAGNPGKCWEVSWDRTHPCVRSLAAPRPRQRITSQRCGMREQQGYR